MKDVRARDDAPAEEDHPAAVPPKVERDAQFVKVGEEHLPIFFFAALL